MTRRLRALVTTSTFPVDEGDGVPRFVQDLARALAAHADVTVLAPDAPGARRSEVVGGVRVKRFSYFRPRSLQRLALGHGMRENLRASWLAKAQVPAFLAAQAAATRSLIREEAIEVVNAHWIVPSGLTSAWACRTRGVPLVLQVHAGDVYLLARVPAGRPVARYVVGGSRIVLADGSHVRDSLDALLGRPSGALLRPMGVDHARFGRRDADEEGARLGAEFPEGFLLFFGRMSEKKGVAYLIGALPRILERHPGLGLVLIGDGPERTHLEETSADLGVRASVRFLGRKSHDEIIRHLHACRAAVVPSIVDRYGETEGMPTVVLEALAAGVRVVGSAVDGIPDILRHRENGWLCREKDPVDLADKILEALEARDDSPVLEAAVSTAASHDWKAVAGEYVRFLEEAVSRTASRPDLTGGGT